MAEETHPIDASTRGTERSHMTTPRVDDEFVFSAIDRKAGAEDELVLTSVGIDIGSSTSHLIFSQLILER